MAATIIVEDGSEVAGANSYVSEVDLETYATDRGLTIAGTKSALLIQAMDYIEAQPFKGIKSTDTQPLQWPRTDVYIDSYPVDYNEIPQLLIDALCEVALGVDAGNNPLATQDRETKRETVGPITVEYMDGARNTTYLTAAETKLEKLLQNGGSGANAKAVRA